MLPFIAQTFQETGHVVQSGQLSRNLMLHIFFKVVRLRVVCGTKTKDLTHSVANVSLHLLAD